MRSLHHYSENLNEWLANRRWKMFVWGLPVVLSLLILAIVAGIVVSRGKTELLRRYDRIVKNALATGRFEVARVASLRGLNEAKNERDRAQWIYYLALAMNGEGHRQDTVALISAAAPLDPLGAGCLDAQLAMAQSLLVATNLTDADVRLAKLNPTNTVAQILHQAERHLLSAVAIDPGSEEANELLARFYLKTGQPAKARDRLMNIYVDKPEVALLLAVSADLENDVPSAQQWAGRALITFENNILKSAPQDNPEDRKGLLQALMIEQKFTPYTEKTSQPRMVITNTVPQDSPLVWLGIAHMLFVNGKVGAALQTLERQMHEHPDPAYPPAIGVLCATLVQSVPPGQKRDSALCLRLIQEGLTNAPDNRNLQFLLIQTARGTGDTAQAATTLLDQRVASAKGEVLAWWYFEMALEAGNRGDALENRRKLLTAYHLAPKIPQLRNNLAMSDLDSTNRADWVEALALIQPVVAQYPEEPIVRGTRGQVLARLGRNREAVDDLEFAVARLSDPAEDRRILAKTYAALGIVHHDASSADQLVQVQTLINNGEYAAAVKTLEQALLVNSNSVYATAMGDACVAWLENSRPASAARRLELIQKGLNSDPQNQKLQAQLLQAARATDDSSAAAKKLLAQLVAGSVGDTAAEWHLLLGRDARVSGDLTVARRELQAAYQLTPYSTEVQIELATVLAAGSPADQGHALALIQLVVDAFPDNAEFRNTRGRILASLGKNQAAVNDLNFAADRLSDASETKETRLILAKAYDALNKPQLAEQQRRLAGMTP